jgi:Tol biopolymer transport system component
MQTLHWNTRWISILLLTFLLVGCYIGKPVSTRLKNTSTERYFTPSLSSLEETNLSTRTATLVPSQTIARISTPSTSAYTQPIITKTMIPSIKFSPTPSFTPSRTRQPTVSTPTETPSMANELASYTISFANFGPGYEGIDIIRADGSYHTQLTLYNRDYYYQTPAWSPDGLWIAFARSHIDSTQLYIMRVKDGPIFTLTSGAFGEIGPSWSPDGQKIVYNEIHNGQTDIYIINRDGTGRKALAASQLWESSPAWSPDNQTIAYYQQQEVGKYAEDLYVMNADGTNKRKLLEFTTWGSGGLSWSPDSQHIAFKSYDDCRIYIINPDGSDLHMLKNAPQYAANPAWSPDGKYITYNTDLHSCFPVAQSHIYVISIDGGDPIQITNDPDWTAIEPSWSPILGLQIGKTYRITEDGANLNLRENPSLQSQVVKKLLEAEIVTIIEGPAQADGYSWWKMRTADGAEGWAVDVAGWYAPVDAALTPTLTPAP